MAVKKEAEKREEGKENYKKEIEKKGRRKQKMLHEGIEPRTFHVALLSISLPFEFLGPYPGNLWLVWLGILHCSLWPVQTIKFPEYGGRSFKRKQK